MKNHSCIKTHCVIVVSPLFYANDMRKNNMETRLYSSFFVSFSIISQKQEKRVRDNKKYGKLSANKVLRDFISWNKEAIDNTFS